MALVILYATVSGNAEVLARFAAGRLAEAGREALVANMADFPADRLGEFDRALVIASTWGDGAPPPDAAAFCLALQDATRRLPGLRYAVFALGAKSYADFCGCGRRLDRDLARCGAGRLLPCVTSDTKFKHGFEHWLGQVEAVLTAAEVTP